MKRRLLLAAAIGVLAVSCSDQTDISSVEPQAASLVGETIVIERGDEQVGPAGEKLPIRIRFSVLDNLGAPMTRVRGTISVTAGGGSVSKTNYITSFTGRVIFDWTLGATGPQTVTITLNGSAATQTVSAVVIPAGSQLQLVGGNNQAGTAGDSLPVSVRVKLVDPSLNIIEGATISWSVQEGGGGVRFKTRRTNATGISLNVWGLGWEGASQKLVAKVPGLDSLIFNATASAAGYTLSIVSGNNQVGTPGDSLANRIVVIVRDALNNPVEDAKGTFAVTSGGGTLSLVNFRTNSLGRAVTKWTLGATGTQTVQATVGIIGSVNFNATFAVPTSLYDFDIIYLSSATPAQQAAVNAAVARWREVIVGDLLDTNFSDVPDACGIPGVNGPLDDIRIYIDFSLIDGPGSILGQAGPCYYRGGSFLPLNGILRLDAADLAGMESNGSMEDVILHEIGHILGIGTLWGPLAKNLRDFAATDSVRFNGPLATAAFNANGGNLFAGPKVPLENCVGIFGCGAGTIDAHWREGVMGHELMTGYLSGAVRPLSLITVQSLADFGYTVSTTAADPYTVSAGLLAAPGPNALPLTELPPPPQYEVDMATGATRPRR